MSPSCSMRAVMRPLAILILFSCCNGSNDEQPCHRAGSPSGVAFCEEKFGTLNKWVCTDQTCPLIRIQKRGCVTLDLMQLAGYQPDDRCVFDPGDWMVNDESESGTTSSMSTTSDSNESPSSSTEVSTSTGSETDDEDSESTSNSGSSSSSSTSGSGSGSEDSSSSEG